MIYIALQVDFSKFTLRNMLKKNEFCKTEKNFNHTSKYAATYL